MKHEDICPHKGDNSKCRLPVCGAGVCEEYLFIKLGLSFPEDCGNCPLPESKRIFHKWHNMYGTSMCKEDLVRNHLKEK